MVAKCYLLKAWVDYKVFSSVVEHAVIHMLLVWVASYNLEFEQLDAKTMFLDGKPVYVKPSKGFVVERKENYACKLRKSLYGIK